MKFLLDQDVYAVTVRFLRQLGHDVVTAGELGMARAFDTDLLAYSSRLNRIFVSRDKDFGELVFVSEQGKGVLFLRITPATIQSTHAQLDLVLHRHSESELAAAFVVIEPGRYRFRKLV